MPESIQIQTNGATVRNPEEVLRDGLARAIQHQEARRLTEAGALLDRLAAEFGDKPVLTHYRGLNAMLEGDTEGGLATVVC